MNKKTNTNRQLTFKISKIWGSSEGSTEKHTIDEKVSFDSPEIDPATNLQAELLLIKLKDEISVLLSTISIGLRLTCNRCLSPYIAIIEIPYAERQFLAHQPIKQADPFEIFSIDLKYMTIDLTEMVRQEIILHFPFIPVCSESCKGLCQHCGKDLNKGKCSCKEEEVTIQKPFQNLKAMMKEAQKKRTAKPPKKRS